MGAVSQKVHIAVPKDVWTLYVVLIRKTLAVYLEKLLCVAGPLDAFFRSGAAHLPNLQPVLGDFRLVHDILLAVVVFEPGGVNHA